MNNMLKHIQDKIGAENCRLSSCNIRSCSRDRCLVYLDGITPDRVIADADSEGLDQFFPGKRCDFILFLKNPTAPLIVPLELKSGRLEPEHVAEQLQAGADFAQRMLKELEEGMIPQSCHLVCQPILLHGKKLQKDQLQKLNQAKIDFRGAQWTIQTARCGKPGNLAKALSDQREQSQTRSRRRRKVKSG